MRSLAKTAPSAAVAEALKRLGAGIKAERISRNMRSEDLAVAACMSRNTLTKVEAGDPSPAIGAYAAVLEVLGMVEALAVASAVPQGATDVTAVRGPSSPRRGRA